ncbi:MAG: hypothetical protein ACXWL8_05550 [Candidatus Limnocylindria bacterium]
MDRPHQQAQAALQRWAAAVAAAGGQQGLAVVGERTGQIGDWEPQVGGNNKLALLAGKVESATTLPTDTPRPAAVQWDDGSVRTLRLMSAAQALQELQDSGGQPCPDCAALEITGAKLESVDVETTRGGATAPAWDFSLQGTAVHLTQVAIPAAATVRVSPPLWDPSDAPVGISIDFATGRIGSLDLTVYFVGAIGPKSDPCGADYEAEAVESPLAIVVIVTEDPHSAGGGCRLVGTTRIATVHLAAPLGERAVLEVRDGLPVPVTMRS